MKKLLILLAGFVALTLTASAQNFEGTITWSFKVNMSAEMNQQMQGAQSMMNDPAMLAQMQAAMSDPQMKAMMENNPQMKAMMDGMGKAPKAGGNMMDGMFPKSMSVKIKGNSSLSLIEGGMTTGETLTLADKNLAYLIDRPSRTYSPLSQGAAASRAPAAKYKITRTSETATILGYTCKKIIVEDTAAAANTPSTYVLWSTTDIAGANSKQFAQMKLSEGSDTSFMSSIEGVPLRMEIAAEGMKVTIEATAVKKESLADSLFVLPAGFTERKLMGK